MRRGTGRLKKDVSMELNGLVQFSVWFVPHCVIAEWVDVVLVRLVVVSLLLAL